MKRPEFLEWLGVQAEPVKPGLAAVEKPREGETRQQILEREIRELIYRLNRKLEEAQHAKLGLTLIGNDYLQVKIQGQYAFRVTIEGTNTTGKITLWPSTRPYDDEKVYRLEVGGSPSR
jgi:hypothetical protein